MNDTADTSHERLSRIEAALETLGLAADQHRAPQMLRYLQLLVQWNKAYNLTAVRDFDAMLVQHLFDSLAVVGPLRSMRQGRPTQLADIGSGAGLPGVVVSICEPEWQITCIDAVHKKAAFIRQVAGVLGLAKLKAVHGRIEDLPTLQADLIISRAFASLADFAKLSKPHLAPGGTLLAMKGRYPEDELQALDQTGWKVCEIRALEVPHLKAQRCLIRLGLKDIHECR